jgi:hypothetical protein
MKLKEHTANIELVGHMCTEFTEFRTSCNSLKCSFCLILENIDKMKSGRLINIGYMLHAQRTDREVNDMGPCLQ